MGIFKFVLLNRDMIMKKRNYMQKNKNKIKTKAK